MGLKDRLNEDLKAAMKAGDKERVLVIRTLLSDVKNEGIRQQKRDEMSDDGVVQVLMKAVKTRRDSIEQFEKGNRPDLVARERAQIAIIEQYLPAQLSEEEIRAVVAQCKEEAAQSGKVEVGTVMKLAMAKLKGKADGKVVQQVVTAMLKP
jgi:uncharacterized protein YqeY